VVLDEKKYLASNIKKKSTNQQVTAGRITALLN
jgi:hypothetical protein